MTIVVVGTAIAVLVPRSWTAPLFHFSQVIVPMQDAASGTLQSVVDRLQPAAGNVSRDDYDALARTQAAMAHRTAALALRAAELERQVEVLTATRMRNVDGGRIGARGRLIPARVLADDLLSWRASRLITAGSTNGSHEGAAVMSNFFSIDTGDVDGLHPGLAIVLGEIYIGVVDQASLHTSRVRLVTDPATEMKVRIGRSSDSGFLVVERYFWMVGRGGGLMEIRDVEAREVNDGTVAVGDWVLSDPLDPALPSALVIGQISHVEKDRKNPLFSVLTVESAAPLEEIERVYIYDPTEAPASAGS
jgi:cell shape-determining protein MreC